MLARRYILGGWMGGGGGGGGVRGRWECVKAGTEEG